jgi:AcrR family transcriptional regulator
MSVAVISITQLMSVTVITYHGDMVRWEPGARGRLERAAFELFVERGFEQVTVAEIAERAGLTERTFFRYFADKREVLFSGSVVLQDLMVSAVATAPPDAPPIDADAAGTMFDGHVASARRRQGIITAHAELRERELIKLAALAAALADALRARGVRDPAASLTGEAGIAIFKIAFERWAAEPDGPELTQVMRAALDELKAVTAGK